MNIAIANKDLKQLFSLFPAIISEFQDCMRVFSNDNYYVPEEEQDSQIFLARRRYTSSMNSIISVNNSVIDYLEDYTGEINDSSACLDLIRGLVIYGANRRKEVDRASKTARGESYIVSENHATNIYGFIKNIAAAVVMYLCQKKSWKNKLKIYVKNRNDRKWEKRLQSRVRRRMEERGGGHCRPAALPNQTIMRR